MKIGLIDVDSHNFPNLALMKISTYHKANGDHVEWWFHHSDGRSIKEIYADLLTDCEVV